MFDYYADHAMRLGLAERVARRQRAVARYVRESIRESLDDENLDDVDVAAADAALTIIRPRLPRNWRHAA